MVRIRKFIEEFIQQMGRVLFQIKDFRVSNIQFEKYSAVVLIDNWSIQLKIKPLQKNKLKIWENFAVRK